MRSFVISSATHLLAAASMGAVLLFSSATGRLLAQSASVAAKGGDSVAAASPAAEIKTGKKPKNSPGANESTSSPTTKKPKDLTIPLPVGEHANGLKLPETDLKGTMMSLLRAAQVKRLDEQRLELKEMNLDLYKPDGKEDFHIIIPTSIFNLSTRIITSQEPVQITTQDFELTGEKMEFNTIDREGRLFGKVRMLIHNLKTTVGQPDPTPKPE